MDFVVCVCLGWWLDRVWNLKPWLTLAGTFTGLLAMFSHLAVLAIRASRRSGPVAPDPASPRTHDHDVSDRIDSHQTDL